MSIVILDTNLIQEDRISGQQYEGAMIKTKRIKVATHHTDSHKDDTSVGRNEDCFPFCSRFLVFILLLPCVLLVTTVAVTAMFLPA